MKNQQENPGVFLNWSPNRPHDSDGIGLATLTLADSKLRLRLASREQAESLHRFTEAAIRLAYLTGRMSMVNFLQYELGKQTPKGLDVSKGVQDGHGLT